MLELADLLMFFGRLHPLLLHLPIGFLAALAALEGLARLRRRAAATDAVVALAWLAAAAAVSSAITGLTLSYEPGYGGDTLSLHMWLGIAVAAASVIVALLAGRPRARAAYVAALLVTLGLLLPAGHLGASLTHGENFLFEPFRADRAAPAETRLTATYSQAVAPLFEQYCHACHGPAKARGGLALHTPESIRAGEVVVPGKPAESKMLVRLRLPLEHEDHMPPADRSRRRVLPR
jgi:uncharacterized membrane protein